MKLQPEDTLIQAFWIDLGSSVVPDYNWERIDFLTRDYLAPLKEHASGDKLYRDPADGRLWELIHPNLNFAGGGPPILKVVSAEQAVEKYGSVSLP